MIINGDALHIPLADETVQTVVTSPPYFSLRDYQVNGQIGLERNVNEYVEKLVQVFREVRRVLRPDGTLFLNLGDSYNGSGGAGGDYNPGGLKEGQPRYPGHDVDGLKAKDLIGVPWRVAFALQADGWWLRSDIIWSKPNPMPEPVTDRPTKSHEYVFLLTKRAKYYYDAQAVMEPFADNRHGQDGAKIERVRNVGGRTDGFTTPNGWNNPNDNQGRNRRTVWTIPTSPYSGAHFATFPPDLVRPCILAGSSPRACEKCGAPWERITKAEGGTIGRSWNDHNGDIEKGQRAENAAKGGNGYRKYTLGWQPTCTCDNQGTGQSIVLDPFAGTFTVGMVAAEYGRRAVGIELSPEYIKLAVERTRGAMAQTVMPI